MVFAQFALLALARHMWNIFSSWSQLLIQNHHMYHMFPNEII
uniref:Uncharacterized protein n=1 Tax=Arundo donax TaxID=35708 RepID=A0A0A9GJR8_ARUDO